MTKDEIARALQLELAEYENQSDINTARIRADQWAQDNGVPLNDPNYLQAFNQVRGQLSIGGSGTGTATNGIVSLSPIRSAEGVDFQDLPPAPAEPRQQGAAMFGAEELASRLPYDPRSITQTPAYNVAGPAALTFYDRILNRPVPVVSKGVLPSGEPTTGITMGRADLQPSGEMDITAVFPSTGANIMGSGLGGTTVGLSAEQAAAAGLPPGSATGTILTTTGDQFVTPGGTLTSDQVIGTTGATPTTTSTFTTDTTGNVVGSALAGTTPPPVTQPPPPPRQSTREEIIQDIYRTSQTKDIAAQRIGDYASSVGGMTAEDIAAAVNPVINEQPGFGITTPVSTQEVLGAVGDFGYGTGPKGTQYITEQAQPLPTRAFPTLAEQQEELRRLDTQAAAVGEGPYTSQEAAMRMLDFAGRQGLSLSDAAASFGMSEADARQRAEELGINLSSVGFNMGGEATSGPSAVDRNLMNRAGIMGAVDDGLSKTLLNNINMVMGRS
tara:strand:- start:13904 stop:15400 length:1497 start_codon:yes stop_codon:yes gene_type:complete